MSSPIPGGRSVAFGAALLMALAVIFCFGTSNCPLSKYLRPSTDNSKAETKSVYPQAPGTLLQVGEADFDREVLQSQMPVLVDFYADWCGPCKLLTPVLAELAGETTSAKIVKVNVDHSPGLAARYGVRSIPTLVVFKGGKPATGLVGLASKSYLRKLLEQ